MIDALCFLSAGDFKTFFLHRFRVEHFLYSVGERSFLSVATVRPIHYHTSNITFHHPEESVVSVAHSPTNALFINLVKVFKFTLKYTIISLLHVSVFNDRHQGSLSVPN